MRPHRGWVAGALCLVLAVGGCGSSKSSSSGQSAADAKSAATGDIPDNQVFLTFHDAAAGYSILYPEGWARKGGGSRTTFQDKNNVIRIDVKRGSAPDAAAVKTDVEKQKSSTPSIRVGTTQTLAMGSGRVIKVTYTSESPPNPVTGRRVKLTVDRYVYASGGRVATVDLGTAVGVDNVDAYRMISRSFKWS